MGWKTIKGRRFFYEDIYVDGERTWKSWGSGIEAQQAALRVEKVKAENARDLALVRAWEERDWGIDKKTDVLDRLVQREVRTFLVQEGFHQQNYRWTKPWTKSRKKTMKDKEIGELNSECVVGRHEENVGLAEGIPLENEVRRLSLEALRGMGGKDPANVTLGCQVDKTIEEVTARVAEMRAEFGYENAIPFEKLLIEQMSTAWVAT